MNDGPRITIEGIQQAQAANLKVIAALKPQGGAGRAVQYATVTLHRYAVAVTHVDSGALRAAHRMSVRGLHGEIYIAPEAVNPKGKRPSAYGQAEHARGGWHAFYDRAVAEGGPAAMRVAEQMIKTEAGL